MKRFLNKKTLVTGGASGIGKAICQRLVEEGADLVFIDRNIEAGKAFEQELSNQESSSLFVAADLTNEGEVERGFHETKKILGHIDVLINNAGGAFGENYKETTLENWNADLALNLTSHYMLTRLVLPEMVDREQGVVTNISSVNGIQALGNPAYSAAKAGLIGFTKAIAQENANKGITVNIIAPGYVGTDMVKKIDPKILQGIVGQIPVGRLADPGEIAALASYLCSEEAGFITGATMNINGGQYMQ